MDIADKINTDEIVMISPTYGRITNPETLAAFAETEEIIRKIRAGEYVKTYDNHKEIMAEIYAELEAEENGEDV